jgi:hypothetical protein
MLGHQGGGGRPDEVGAGRGMTEGARGGVSSRLDGDGTQARLGKRRRGGVDQGVQAWGAMVDDGGWPLR